MEARIWTSSLACLPALVPMSDKSIATMASNTAQGRFALASLSVERFTHPVPK
ncbi:MAG: hypothetical protein OIF56_04620 [Cohaesibacter sp.]|nr:hypothetical protein [Cohaesibacter sp.]